MIWIIAILFCSGLALAGSEGFFLINLVGLGLFFGACWLLNGREHEDLS